MEIEGRIKKWGNSYGVLLPKGYIQRKHLAENEAVMVNVKSKKQDLQQLFGLCHFKKPVKQMMKEIKEGYEV